MRLLTIMKKRYEREQVDRQLELEELEKFMGRG